MNEKPNFLSKNSQNREKNVNSGPDLDPEKMDWLVLSLLVFGKHFRKLSDSVAKDKLRVWSYCRRRDYNPVLTFWLVPGTRLANSSTWRGLASLTFGVIIRHLFRKHNSGKFRSVTHTKATLRLTTSFLWLYLTCHTRVPVSLQKPRSFLLLDYSTFVKRFR